MAKQICSSIILCIAACWLFAGCETSFDVFRESDAYFSMFGFLDASADTQWVRVAPLQDTMTTDTRPLDVRFAMTRLSTGHRVDWQDSLFQFVTGSLAHNVWTVETIHPLETYKLEAVRADGATSIAMVTVPDSFPDPLLSVHPFSLINLPVSGNVCARSFEISISVEHLAALEVTYHVPTRQGSLSSFSESYILKAEQLENGAYVVSVPWVQDLERLTVRDPDIGINELLQLAAVDLFVASAGPNWPDNALDDETLALPGVVTHIENGFGFVGGVVSKRLNIPIGDFRDSSCFE